MTQRSSVLIVTVLVLVVGLSFRPAAAQWLDHPTPAIPRTADGKPNLTAPAPRAADGKPDLSGLWMISGLGHATNVSPTEMLPWAQKLYQQRLETYGQDDPAVGGLPEGPRAGLAGLDPLRIIQTPTMVVILYEVGPARQICQVRNRGKRHGHAILVDHGRRRYQGDAEVARTTWGHQRTPSSTGDSRRSE
jgi:hypothetical protein